MKYIIKNNNYFSSFKKNKTIKKQSIQYGLLWENKLDAKARLLKKHNPKLVKKDTHSIMQNENYPSIKLIKSDNSHALKALQEKYSGKIDVIYIDPPYNTGNKDFIYDDNYLNKDDLYRHSRWLSFMEYRLKLAKKLLTKDGVIFVSIDDNEQARLKLLMDTVFGVDNFIANSIRVNKIGSGHDSNFMSTSYDYTLVYRNSSSLKSFNHIPALVENNKKYNKVDEYVDFRGKYYLRDLQFKGSKARKSTWTVTLPDGNIVESDFNNKNSHEWRWGEKKFAWGIENDFIVFQKNKNNQWKIYIKQYQFVDNNNEKRIRKNPASSLMHYTNSQGSNELRNIMGTGFSYPKYSEFIAHLIERHPNKNAIVLDFFAGSGTTGHAVASLNVKDGGKRECILITDSGKTHDDIDIAEDITYERIKRILTGKNWANGKTYEPLPMNLEYFMIKLEIKQK